MFYQYCFKYVIIEGYFKVLYFCIYLYISILMAIFACF
jgi:hypothetical protein